MNDARNTRRTRRVLARALLAAALASAAYPAVILAADPAAEAPTRGDTRGGAPVLTATVVKSGLAYPWDVTFLPNGRMFVSERPGRIRLYSSGNVGSTLLMTFTVPSVWASGEAGLMGIDRDRNWSENKMLYLCTSRQVDGIESNQVMAYRYTGSTLDFSHFVIRYGMDASTIHNGCAVEHGPDGKLWITMGDAATASRAQDPDSLNGKVLRVNTDGSIPADNPVLPGAQGRSAAYAMGFRNPQGIAFRSVTGEPYTLEHGPDRDDEANWIRPGLNYGWPCYTGANVPYQTSGCGSASNYTPSVWASGAPTLATSGAAFVNHPSWGAWQGDLFVATLKESDLRRLHPVSATDFDLEQTYFDSTFGRLRASTKGGNGRLYLTTSNGSNDKVIRVVATP